MTEPEWLACTNPERGLEFLTNRAGERKLRLFAVACIRRVWLQLNKRRSRRTTELIERYADSHLSLEKLEETCESAWDLLDEMESTDGDGWSDQVEYAGAYAVAQAACIGNDECPYCYRAVDTTRNIRELTRYEMLAAGRASEAETAEASEQIIHADLLREIFGNPFRPITINPAWQTRTVVALAQAAYEDRILPAGTLDTARLAILADALEEAGCDTADILNHLRQPGEHVRGCWVVDLVLNKS
jgi:hypothetical protein